MMLDPCKCGTCRQSTLWFPIVGVGFFILFLLSLCVSTCKRVLRARIKPKWSLHWIFGCVRSSPEEQNGPSTNAANIPASGDLSGPNPPPINPYIGPPPYDSEDIRRDAEFLQRICSSSVSKFPPSYDNVIKQSPPPPIDTATAQNPSYSTAVDENGNACQNDLTEVTENLEIGPPPQDAVEEEQQVCSGLDHQPDRGYLSGRPPSYSQQLTDSPSVSEVDNGCVAAEGHLNPSFRKDGE